jgi:hypothetical protein
MAAFCAAKGWQVAKVVEECGSFADARPSIGDRERSGEDQADLMHDVAAIIPSLCLRCAWPSGRRRAGHKKTQLFVVLEVP